MDTLPAGQSNKSPAFSFYAKEWLAATLSWALDARGAYATLLAYQWDAGSVPGDDVAALARVLGVSSPKARLVWKVISSKFARLDDGTWQNIRLEQERSKQEARREALRNNGSKGGRPKQTETNRFPNEKPNANLNESLPSSSSFANDPVKNTGSSESHAPARLTGNGANAPNALPRDHMYHAICGPDYRLCLKTWECGELMRQYGGDPTKQKAAVVSFVEAFVKSLGPDDAIGAFADVEKNFQTWMKSIGRVPAKLAAVPVKSAAPAQTEAVEQALDTRRRRAEMQAAGKTDDEIEAVFEREYQDRKRQAS